LAYLEADHLHDMWLHIKPMQSILEKNNARMEDFVSWGSVHIVTQKIAEGKVVSTPPFKTISRC